MAKKQNSAKRIFNLRKKYLNHDIPTEKYDNFFDFSLTPYYGKVDMKGNVVYPSERHLVALPANKEAPKDTVYVLNFVADAFADLQNHLNKANTLGLIKNEANNIQTIVPTKGWESVHTKYAAHIRALYQPLVSVYFEKPSEKNGLQFARPTNFDKYLQSVKHLYKTKGSKFPLSRSSFILSQKCSKLISGLVVEIEPSINYSDDAAKNFTYIESANFEFYMRSLRKFGFMADKEYPGRIIADLGTPEMQNYMASYNISLDNLFESYYYKATDYDYECIRVYLIQFYNNYASAYPVVSETTTCHSRSARKYFLNESELALRRRPVMSTYDNQKSMTHTKLIERTPLSDSDIQNKYNQDFWLPVYAEFLNYELSNPLDQHSLEKTIKNAKDLKKNVDFDAAISYIGSKFNFYRYSLEDMALMTNYEDNIKTSTSATTAAATSTSPSNGGGTSGMGGTGGY
jgi:hypothetical protein